MESSGSAGAGTKRTVRRVFADADGAGTPLTTAEVARELDCDDAAARDALAGLAEAGALGTRELDDDTRLWWPEGEWNPETADRLEAEEYPAFVSAVEDYAIFALDPDGVVVSWNDGAARIKGYAADEIVGDHFSTFYTEAARDSGVPDENLAAAAEDGNVEDEGWRVRADGTEFWAHVTITAIRDDGDLQGFTKVTRDMTEQREYERKLQRRKAELETELSEVLGRISDAVCALDEDWRVTHVNERAAALMGASRTDLLGRVLWEAIPDGDAIDRDRFERAMNAQEPVSFDVHAEDRDTWLAYTLYPSESGLSVYFRDVTDRRERERELERTERRFEAIFEDPNILVGLLDPEGTVLDVNSTAMEYVDADREAVQGEPFWETPWWGTDDDVRADVREWVDRAADGEYVDFEADLTRPDGTRYVIDGTFRPVTDEEGEVVSVIASDRDVTARAEHERRLEESERRYRTLAENFPNGAVGAFDDDLRYTLAAGAKLGTDLPPPERLEGSRMPDVFPPATVADLEPLFRRAIDEGQTGHVTTAFGGRDWRVWAAPLVGADGEVFGGLSFAQDVTEEVERKAHLQRFETIVEAVNDGVYVVDADGRFTMVNDAYATLVGYEPEDLVGEHVSLVVDDEVSERAKALEEADAPADADRPTLEAEVITADGDRVPAEANFAMVPEGGEAWHRVGVVRDVSDRVERERELERAFDLLERTERIANVAGWEIDVDTMDVFWTEQLFRVLGIEGGEEPPLETALDMYHEADRAVVQDAIDAALATGESFDVEARIWTEAGDLRWLRIQGVPDVVDGEVVTLRGAAQDVTERTERERQLEQRARQQEVVADLGQFALETEDLDELMREASRQVAAVLDADYSKVLDRDADERELLLRQGVGWHDGVVGQATVAADENSQAGYTLRTEEPVVVDDLATETRFTGPDLLTDHDVTSGISTLVGSVDDPWGVLGVHDTARREFTDEDVTFVKSVANVLAEAIERARYQAELEELVAALEESNERLEQFAYAASHDLQEPLRMVSSYLKLLERRYGDEFDADGREFLAFAVDGADRMRDMIDGLLQYSRVDTRGDPFEPVDLEVVVGDVRENLAIAIEETDAEITVGDLPTVEADENQLHQLVQNLVDNAIEYRGDEPPRIHVSAERLDDRVAVSVADEGVGIAPDDADRIFEVFQRLHTHDEHGGTGIGLALCERIVERHGGEITVDSTPGEGATFTVTLPAVGGDDD